MYTGTCSGRSIIERVEQTNITSLLVHWGETFQMQTNDICSRSLLFVLLRSPAVSHHW